MVRLVPDDTKTVPDGFDKLMSVEEYKLHISSLEAAASAASAAIKAVPMLAEKAAATERKEVLERIDAAIAGWDLLTAAQKSAAMLLAMKAVRFMARRMLNE